MRDYSSIAALPKVPAIYCLLGYSAKGLYNAYVGISSNLQNRISQHLEYRNSSVTTGASAVSVDPRLVGGCRYWVHKSFEDPHVLAGAELIGLEVLNPVLRSRGGTHKNGASLAAREDFRREIELLLGSPTGEALFPDLTALSRRMKALEEKVALLESVIGKKVIS
jgi:hypothetical protein